MREHHYLKGGRSAGDTLRYIAEIDGRTVALLTWGAAAYKLGVIKIGDFAADSGKPQIVFVW